MSSPKQIKPSSKGSKAYSESGNQMIYKRRSQTFFNKNLTKKFLRLSKPKQNCSWRTNKSTASWRTLRALRTQSKNYNSCTKKAWHHSMNIKNSKKKSSHVSPRAKQKQHSSKKNSGSNNRSSNHASKNSTKAKLRFSPAAPASLNILVSYWKPLNTSLLPTNASSSAQDSFLNHTLW